MEAGHAGAAQPLTLLQQHSSTWPHAVATLLNQHYCDANAESPVAPARGFRIPLLAWAASPPPRAGPAARAGSTSTPPTLPCG